MDLCTVVREDVRRRSEDRLRLSHGLFGNEDLNATHCDGFGPTVPTKLSFCMSTAMPAASSGGAGQLRLEEIEVVANGHEARRFVHERVGGRARRSGAVIAVQGGNVDRMSTVPVVVGIALAPVIGVLGRLAGLDRDRAMYPVALIVIAAYYVLFATMGGEEALPAELIGATVFAVIAIIGFRTSLWWVAAGIAGHGVFDFVVHPQLIVNPGMPAFWPAFCGSIDLALGAILAVLLLRRAIPARDGAPTPRAHE